MSVILKSREEIQTMAGGLLYHLDRYRDILAESKVFQKIKNRAGGREGENLEGLFICWLIFHMWVANRVAYSVQYGARISVAEDLPGVAPCRADLRDLAADLRNLDYNIYTNGGQYWMDHEWHSLFAIITERIKEESELCCAGAGR
jgi:hypothetical protein